MFPNRVVLFFVLFFSLNSFLTAQNADFAKAQYINLALFDLHKWLYVEGNPVGVKAAAKALGLCQTYVRLPLIEMSQSNQEKLVEEMKKIREMV